MTNPSLEWRYCAARFRLNAVGERGQRPHVYDHTGRDAATGEPIYQYQGDDVSLPLRLEHMGIDVPSHPSGERRTR